MRVLLTGVSGFIGRHTARALLERGDEVVAIARRGRIGATQQAAGAEITVIDDPAGGVALAERVAEHRIDATVHLAAQFDGGDVIADAENLVDSNVGFATRVAAATAAARPGAPFVATGSIWQHRNSSVFDPVSLYAATKQAFEDILVYYQAAGLLSVRTLVVPDTYGLDDHRGKMVSLLVDAAVKGETLEAASGNGALDLVHVNDAVNGLLQVLSPDCESGRWSLSSGSVVSVREISVSVGVTAGRPVPVEWGVRADPPRHITGLVRGAPSLPGWEPKVALIDGLGELVSEAEERARNESR